jgi:hypothetical protein
VGLLRLQGIEGGKRRGWPERRHVPTPAKLYGAVTCQRATAAIKQPQFSRLCTSEKSSRGKTNPNVTSSNASKEPSKKRNHSAYFIKKIS